MTAVKIGIIGAGSAAFSMNLVRDLCLVEGLRGSTMSFMDIDKERLNVVHNVASRYAKEMKVNLKLEKTLDRKEALQDADFVINTALAGGHSRLEAQRAVEEKLGYYRGIGVAKSYHQFKLMMEIARDMEEICPDAWLLQASNPVFDGCTLMTRETKLKIVGLCHGHYGYRRIAQVLGLDVNKVTAEMPGFNHCIWMTKFLYGNEDAYPLIDEWIDTKAEEYWRTWDGSPFEAQMSRAAVHQYKLYGLFPIGDTLRAPSTMEGWWYHLDFECKKYWYNKYGGFDSEIGWSMYLKRLEERIDRIRQIANNPSISVIQKFPPRLSGEQHVPIIDALTNNNEGKYQVNIPNNGALRGVPNDVVVEVPALVSKRGIQAIHRTQLPKKLMINVLIPKMLRMKRNVEAYLTGDRSILLYIILKDHRTKSLEQAEKLLNKVLSLAFNREAAEHYK